MAEEKKDVDVAAAEQACVQQLAADPELAAATDDMRIRFARARDLDFAEAKKMLLRHLEFRLEHKPLEITQQLLTRSLPAGAWRVAGRGKLGHPILFINSNLWRPHEYDLLEYTRLVLYFMEKVPGLYEGDIKQSIVIFDMSGWSMSHARYHAMIRRLVDINQNHYPERLYAALMIKVPWLFRKAWGWISPWLDKKTSAKVHFVPVDPEEQKATLLQWIDEEVLMEAYGGRVPAYPIPGLPGEPNVADAAPEAAPAPAADEIDENFIPPSEN